MRKNLLIFCFLFMAFTAFTQKKETFDIATYLPPKGWKKELKSTLVNYTTKDNAKGTYCMIGIFQSQPSTGNAANDFAKEWVELVANPYSVADTPQIDTTSDEDGRLIITGSSLFKNNGVDNVVMLTTCSGFGRVISIISLLNSDTYMPDIQKFFNDMTLSKKYTGTITANSNESKKNISNAQNNNSYSGSKSAYFNTKNGIEGVWMGIYHKAFYGDPRSNGSSLWTTFYGNGQVYEAVPDKGFYNFAKAESEATEVHFWNHYISVSHEKWIIKTPGVIDLDVTLNNNNLRIRSQFYQRCKPVDGLRLNGSWTSYADPNDPDLDRRAYGNKPVITFSKNGTFTDEGIFATALQYHRDDNIITAPGSGTYEIKDYSIMLHYDDGHVKQTAFTGFLSIDPAVDDKTITISKVVFTKRSR